MLEDALVEHGEVLNEPVRERLNWLLSMARSNAPRAR